MGDGVRFNVAAWVVDGGAEFSIRGVDGEVAAGSVDRAGRVDWVVDLVGGLGPAIHGCSLAEFEVLLAASRRAVALAGEVAGV